MVDDEVASSFIDTSTSSRGHFSLLCCAFPCFAVLFCAMPCFSVLCRAFEFQLFTLLQCDIVQSIDPKIRLVHFETKDRKLRRCLTWHGIPSSSRVFIYCLYLMFHNNRGRWKIRFFKKRIFITNIRFGIDRMLFLSRRMTLSKLIWVKYALP